MNQQLPPNGETPLARRHHLLAAWARFRREHPALYATRHVALATLKVLIPFLGLGALLTALLPSIDWSWLREAAAEMRSLLPDIDLSMFWRADREPAIKDSQLGAVIRWIVPRVKWSVPIVLAVFVAVEEIERHKRNQGTAQDDSASTARSEDQHPG